MGPSGPTTLAVREASRSISKPKPKIRIVHIFAPEVIKTDAANFRELVQRLTGKPTKRAGRKKRERRQITRGELEEEKERSVVWRVDDENLGGGDNNNYLSGLGDADGFFQGFNDYPAMLNLSSSSHMDHMIGGARVM
ncbi:VQ motif-containing protein 25-like [Asparagus officinalis]|nr:VQ motif-containing protein 25-like [Asparagus officinalis]